MTRESDMHGGSRDLLVRHRKELNQDLREFLDPALLRDENGNKVFDKKNPISPAQR
jgi:hypothetical protein